jgi:flagellar M-ring protein FliF
MISQVEGIVKSAVGFDSSRGDVVTVENVPFFEPDESLKAELEKARQTDTYIQYGGMAVPILATLLLVFFVLRPLVKFLITPSREEIDLAGLLPSQLIDADTEAAVSAITSDAGAAGVAGSKSGLAGLQPVIDIEQYEEVMAENSRLVKDNPQQAALLIRYWLNDGKI